MKATFPGTHRLRTPDSFKRVFASPVRLSASGLTVLARRGTETGPRLGLAISKKVAKRAVDRNRLKRIIRESFRINAQNLPLVDIVVLARRGAPQIPAADLRLALDGAWNLLRSKPWTES